MRPTVRDVAGSACVCVCVSVCLLVTNVSPTKRLNRSRCHLRFELTGPQKTVPGSPLRNTGHRDTFEGAYCYMAGHACRSIYSNLHTRGSTQRCGQLATITVATYFYAPALVGHFGIARSVRPSLPWRSCLGYRHAGCL